MNPKKIYNSGRLDMMYDVLLAQWKQNYDVWTEETRKAAFKDLCYVAARRMGWA